MTINEEDLNSSIIETVDEEGNPVKFELLDILEIDGKNYGLLYPLNENQDSENEEDEEEAVVMRLIQEEEEYVFEQIEDDEEFEKVANYIENLKEDI